MSNSHHTIDYSEKEEFFNVLTHGAAAICAGFATIWLVIVAWPVSWLAVLSVLVYGLSMVALFCASTCYHSATHPRKRAWLKKLDHTAIYYLIAGTYTPFMALFIPTTRAKILLVILWIIALIGTVFKLFFVHKFARISLAAYILMGWLALFVIQDLIKYLTTTSLNLVILGGVMYTIGTIFYAIKKLPYAHVIWHIFVILGAFSHFFAILLMLK